MKITLILLFFFLSHFCLSQTIDDYLMSADDKIENRDFKCAIIDCNKAIEIKPRSALSYYYRGLAKGKSGKTKAAVKDFEKAIKLGAHPDYFYQKGLVEYYSKKHKKAWVSFNKALAINPKYTMAYCYRSLIYSVYLHDYKNAVKDLDIALDIEKNDARIFSHRGRLKMFLYEGEHAIADFNKAIIIDPEYAEAYYYRAIVKASLNSMNDACSDMELARQLDESRASSWIEKNCK